MSKTSDDLIKGAMERFEESESGTNEVRQDALDDIRFARLGEQWPEAVEKIRKAEGRPCLTINKLPAFIRQVVNESRQNKPGIVVSPVDSGADVDTAKVISGIVRSIERESNADVAYDTAIDHAVSGGFGFFRIGIEYAHPTSFDMVARIHRVPNPLMVHWDSNSTEFDASDWRYAFVSDILTDKEFKDRFPKAAAVSFEGDHDDVSTSWKNEDGIRIAEYWIKEEEKKNLLMLTGIDGTQKSIREDHIPKVAQAALEGMGLDLGPMSDDELTRLYMHTLQLEETRRRVVMVPKVTRQLISGVEVLEESEDWPGSNIPICPVWGEEVFVDGRRHFRSMIRDAKDPQAMFNFWRAAST